MWWEVESVLKGGWDGVIIGMLASVSTAILAIPTVGMPVSVESDPLRPTGTLLAVLDIRVQVTSEASRIVNTVFVRRPVRTLASLTQ